MGRGQACSTTVAEVRRFEGTYVGNAERLMGNSETGARGPGMPRTSRPTHLPRCTVYRPYLMRARHVPLSVVLGAGEWAGKGGSWQNPAGPQAERAADSARSPPSPPIPLNPKAERASRV